jgi:hypothetical protein
MRRACTLVLHPVQVCLLWILGRNPEAFMVLVMRQREKVKFFPFEWSVQSLTGNAVTHCLELAKTAKDRDDGRPVNFGEVFPGVFRSGYPESDDHEYLKNLNLKTIV